MSERAGGELLERLAIEHPVMQAGMAGGAASGQLAGAVSAAGAMGTVGMMAPRPFLAALRQAKALAAGRPVAANLLVPFIRRAHVDACVQEQLALVVLHGGLSARWVRRLQEGGLTVMVTVGTRSEALRALGAGADGVVAQGYEAGGHLLGVRPLEQTLAEILDAAGGAPVFAAGGVADAIDVRRLVDAGATAAVAGTRFLLTSESGAHPAYKQRLLAASETFTTLLFGLGWPLRHRVIANRATERWCSRSEDGPRPVRLAERLTAPLARLTPLGALGAMAGMQRPGVPLFSPALPVGGMPDRAADSLALYAGETVVRLHDVIPAAQAVARLAASRA
ncbi:MAG TPA: nitronate monooxygenase [Gemmatimonadales bacterium]|nr:nitronate monooxygenase [Gemmatimonadales bacterium]